MNIRKSRRYRNQRGATMPEYALLLSLISVVSLTAIASLGENIARTLTPMEQIARADDSTTNSSANATSSADGGSGGTSDVTHCATGPCATDPYLGKP